MNRFSEALNRKLSALRELFRVGALNFSLKALDANVRLVQKLHNAAPVAPASDRYARNPGMRD